MTEWVKRPKRYVPDLRRFGALCEGNYRRLGKLRQLAPSEQPAFEFELYQQSRYLGRVRVEVIQTTKFTETLLLEQVHSQGRWLNNPQMTVRLYHDASMAEVISCYRQRRIAAVNDYPNRFMHHPDEKTQINGFLAEWLEYCLRLGHAPMDQLAWTADGLD